MRRYEVLARFPGDQSADDGVADAERAGLIADVDMGAVTAAARALETDKDAPGLAVNLSVASLFNDQFVDAMLRQATRLGAHRRKLSFEITETSAIDDLGRADAIIQSLRRGGHHVHLDDFGAGATALPYLTKLDVDGVKIDGAYILEALSSPKDAALIEAIATFCRKFSMETIAERVQNEQQSLCLGDLGVDLGQGYYFGEPAPLLIDLELFPTKALAASTET